MNLKAVHSCSTSSLNNLEQFGRLGYSFRRHCEDRCLDEAVSKIEIKRSLDCPCAPYIRADSVTQVIYLVIRNYFSALADLSDDKAIAVNTDNLKSALLGGNYGSLHISAGQADAYAGVSQLLVSGASGAYRKAKISEFISEGNQPVLLLISQLRFILDTNLAGEIAIRKEKLFESYSNMKRLKALKNPEKARLTEQYYRQIFMLDDHLAHIKIYSSALKDIAAAHQKMFENKANLNSREGSRAIQMYAARLDALWNQMNQTL